jgi:predicted Mrr-cat superfamily restriction endonuclease
MKLPLINSDSKYWVVRAGAKAKYYEHFRQHNVIALGHINNLVEEEGIIDTINGAELAKLILNVEKKQKTSQNRNSEVQTVDDVDDEQLPSENQISAKVTQATTFINEMKVGDLVITVDSKWVLLGTITSEAYTEANELFAFKADGTAYERNLAYKLRRKVVWQQAKLRASIPAPIKPSLYAHQTLFSISDTNRELFSHWLYGIFLEQDKLYFSTAIEEKSKISQFSLVEFQRTIQKLEMLAEKIEHEGINFNDDLVEDLEIQYIIDGMSNAFTLTTKNVFLSPGHMWSEVNGSIKKRVIMGMLIGGMLNANVEAADDVDITDQQKVMIARSVEVLKGVGGANSYFEMHRSNLKASLSKPNKTSVSAPQDNLEGKARIVFPKISDEGETGL